MSKIKKIDRITHLEFQVTWLTNSMNELLGTENLEFQPQLKQLDHSIFNGLDEKWRFAGVDSNSEACVFDGEPEIRSNVFGMTDELGGANDYLILSNGYDTSNWQDSLIERDTATEQLEVDLSSEPTGSELCKAMLERGDKYVMCAIGDVSDADALDSMVVDNAMSSNEDWFDCFDGRSWKYAVPVNNMGEPLTAAEVGI